MHFTEEQSTNLATLHGRALDSRLAEPILGDTTAEDAVRQIDYDFAKFRVNRDQAVAIAARAKIFDGWTRQFLHERPNATVLHLGCVRGARNRPTLMVAEGLPMYLTPEDGEALLREMAESFPTGRAGEARLTLMEQRNATDFATSELLSRASWKVRLQLKLAAAIPVLRNMGQVLRYRF